VTRALFGGRLARLSPRRPSAALRARLSLRRALAALLLPLSLAPVALLAPGMVRAPVVLERRTEALVERARLARRRPPPPQPARYPAGASRLERDVFAPVAGPLTPQVGVSPLAEHQTPAERAQAPIVLITGEPEGGAR